MIPEELKKRKSIAAFKVSSKKQMIEQYAEFECRQVGCVICEV